MRFEEANDEVDINTVHQNMNTGELPELPHTVFFHHEHVKLLKLISTDSM